MNRRLRLLFAAAALAGVWSGWVQFGAARRSAVVGAAEPRHPMPAPLPTSVHGSGTAAALRDGAPDALAMPARHTLAADAQQDAFATRNWQPPPPPPPPPPPVVQAPPAPPAPPPPPTLPYRFVGLLDDAKAGTPSVFLAVGEKLIVARPGDLLEGGFRLDRIDAAGLDFTHVQRGVVLHLAVTGAPS